MSEETIKRAELLALLQRERDAIWRRGHEGDDDIPIELQRELQAFSTPEVTYDYLAKLWRRGREAGIAGIIDQIEKDERP